MKTELICRECGHRGLTPAAFLCLYPYPAFKEPQNYKQKECRHSKEDAKADPHRDVGHPKESPAEGVDHVEDGVKERHGLPKWSELADGEEDAAKICERGQGEGGDY